MKSKYTTLIASLLLTLFSCNPHESQSNNPSSSFDSTQNSESDISSQASSDLISSDEIISSSDETSSSSSEMEEEQVLDDGYEYLTSTYTFKGKQFKYKDLTQYGTYEDNADGLTLTSFGPAVTDSYIVIPDEVDGKKVTEILIKDANKNKVKNNVRFLLTKNLTSINPGQAIAQPSFLFNGSVNEWLNINLAYDPGFFGNVDLYLVENTSYTLLTDLVVEENITEIRKYAFAGINITSLSLPSSVKTIHEQAFANAKKLTSLVLPEGLEKLDFFAFCNCFNLKDIVLPSTLSSLNASFQSCQNLLSVEIKEGCNASSDDIKSAFTDCNKIYRFLMWADIAINFTMKNLKLTIENEHEGDIFVYNNYYFGKCGDEYTLLSYFGPGGEIYLPTSIKYKEEVIVNYSLGFNALERSYPLPLDLDLTYDAYTLMPILTTLHIPSNITALKNNSLKYYLVFTDGQRYLSSIYFDFTEEELSSLLPGYNTPFEIPTHIDLYCKEHGRYVLIREGRQY